MSTTKPIKRAASATTGKPAKKGKKDKIKVIRDSFTMPQNDYARIAELKEACLDAGLHVKKSELLRAGLIALGKLRTVQLKRMITQLEQVKTGRPKNH
jgi:hypothetical protein